MKNILITGGTAGIGKEAVLKFTTNGYQVYFTGRNAESGNAVIAEALKVNPDAKIHFIQGDLSTISNCYALVEKIKIEVPALDILVNNAGVWVTEPKLNADGFETDFMVNYLAPVILCESLTDLLSANAPSLILNVNSDMHLRGKFDLEKTPKGEDFEMMASYGSSKQASAMYSIDLAERLKNKHISVNAFHPGVYNTNLNSPKGLLGIVWKLVKPLMKSPSKAGDVFFTLVEKTSTVTGQYFNLTKLSKFGPTTQDAAFRNQLWKKTRVWIKK